jgi:hypothetical protein
MERLFCSAYPWPGASHGRGTRSGGDTPTGGDETARYAAPFDKLRIIQDGGVVATGVEVDGWLQGFVAAETGFEFADAAIGDQKLLVLSHVFEERIEKARLLFGAAGLAILGLRGDDSEFGMVDDGVDCVLLIAGGGRVRGVAREGAVCDLEGIEHHAGLAGFDGAGGDGVEDLSGGEADGVAVLGHGDIEGWLGGGSGFACSALPFVVDGDAGGVVVIAEVLAAETWAAAAVAVGEDVTTLIAGVEEVIVFSDGGRVLRQVVVEFRDGHHGCVPPPYRNRQHLEKKRFAGRSRT